MLKKKFEGKQSGTLTHITSYCCSSSRTKKKPHQNVQQIPNFKRKYFRK